MAAKQSSRPPRRRVTVGDAAAALDTIAPPALAQPWDNVGLLIGDPQAPGTKVLLCIDLTPAVLQEAIAGKFNLVMAYHPPLFKPVKRLRADSDGTDALVHRAIQSRLAIYAMHTAFDAAAGGPNDVLAGLCGLTDTEPFEYVATAAPSCKLVTFVPPEQLEIVASALFCAGAGRIGDYEQCSYRLAGEGTFFGTEGTNPAVGLKGRLERAQETRLEVVVPNRRQAEVVAALRSAHPYEEPAFDLYPLTPAPTPGIGRVGALPAGTTLGELARTLKKATGSKVAMLVGDPNNRLQQAAVCVGAAGSLPFEMPRAASCDVIVTGEIRHHDALTILRTGKCAIALGHWESERPALKPLARRLNTQLKGLTVKISDKDTGPLTPA